MEQWRGKWALITGASSGIGWALAEQLAARGANLVLTARRADRLARLADDVTTRYKVQAQTFTADLARCRVWRLWRVPQDRGAAFVGYGAGQHRLGRAATHLFLPPMVDRRSGYILIVASTAAFQPVPYISTYAATKGFDLLFAEGLAEEVRRYGVRVCALCPGSTVSEFNEVARQPVHLAGPQEPNEKVARVGLEALAAGKSRVISGTRNWLSVEAQRLAPRRLVTRVAARLFMPQE